MRKHDNSRHRVLLVGVTALLVLPAHSADSDHIINRAIAAAGGDRLTAITSIVMEWRFDDSLIMQSRRPAPPWDRTRRWESYAVDFDTHRYADVRYDGGSGYESITGTVFDAAAAFRLDYRSRSCRDLSLKFDGAIADAMLLSPPVLLRWLAEHRDSARYTGQSQVNGTEVLVLEVNRENAEDIELWVDVDSGRVFGLESAYTDYDGSRVPLRFRFFDWNVSSGLQYPARIEVRAHDDVARRASLERITVDESIDRYLQVPDDFRQSENEAPNVREFRFEEMAAGVHFVGQGVMYQLIVEFDDFLVALDGSSGDVGRRIDSVRQRIPGKPFRYVLASHHHDDHLHSLDEFAALGTAIIAAPAHAAIVREYVENRLGIEPEIISVTDEFIVSSGGRELRVMDVGPTPHSEHMLVAHLPAEKILFAADLFVLGGRRTPVRPAMANGIALFEQIAMRNLGVHFIVDPHSPLIATMSDLQQAVDELNDVRQGVTRRALTDLSAWRSAHKHLQTPHRSGIDL